MLRETKLFEILDIASVRISCLIDVRQTCTCFYNCLAYQFDWLGAMQINDIFRDRAFNQRLKSLLSSITFHLFSRADCVSFHFQCNIKVYYFYCKYVFLNFSALKSWVLFQFSFCLKINWKFFQPHSSQRAIIGANFSWSKTIICNFINRALLACVKKPRVSCTSSHGNKKVNYVQWRNSVPS